VKYSREEQQGEHEKWGTTLVRRRVWDNDVEQQSCSRSVLSWAFPFLDALGKLGGKWQLGGGEDAHRMKNQNARDKPKSGPEQEQEQ